MMARENIFEKNKFLTSGKSKEEIEKMEEEKHEPEPIETTENTGSETIQSGIVISHKKAVNKKNVTFYLKEENIAMLEKLSGKGKGKTGYNKSELVDLLLEQAFSMLKMK